MLFFKLINSSFKRNRKIYLPYLISMAMLVAINYIFKAIAVNRSIKKLPSGSITGALMDTGSTFIILVTLAFMVYINRFLWQQRHQEMGLYSMLGMTSHHLRILMVIEKLYLLVISLTAGFATGIIFDRLAFLGFARLLNIKHLSQPWIEWSALGNTCLIIGGFFLLLVIIDLVKLIRLNPAELWHPRKSTVTKHGTVFTVAGILGMVAVAWAYYLTLTVKPRMSALSTFMLAVVLVVVGTYLLFIAGSIIVLQLLQKNKRYYYQPRHFIAVSGMLQRMEQNGASLATICLLCSSVLVILFGSITLYLGIDSTVRSWAPREVTIVSTAPLNASQNKTIKQVANEHQATLGHQVSFNTSTPQYGYWQKNHFINQGGLDRMTNNTTSSVIFISAKTYQQLTKDKVQLANDEALFYSPATKLTGSLQIGNRTYKAKQLKHFDYYLNPSHSIYSPVFLVVNKVPAKMGTTTITTFNYQLTGSVEKKAQFEQALQDKLQVPNLGFTGYHIVHNLLTQLYGGIVFVGILISLALGITTTVVIYFKQITEGYEDQQRFKTMQQVGLSERETTRSIHSQVLMVFLLPVIGAVVNLGFAIPAIRQIMIQFGFYNTQLMMTVAITITIILLLAYLLIYGLTTRVYRQIVDQA
ncbi:ABC transporter permease [Limosilactobacillus caccae]|uniref:ABC transporter permease n=1 Tax=Limosilactobacillus caccae TaxID=1926284 RepID=UPI0009705D66|nr:FtsX-like permease family protein [Limosilactobacillus caccae]